MPTTSETTEALMDSLTRNVQALVLDHEQLAVGDFDDANAPRQWSQEIKKVSVLIPLYNQRWTIDQLLRRVLSSPVGIDFEVIVVDDGSTDGSGSVVKQIAQQDARITLVRHESRRGKGASIRTAIQHIAGDAVVIQDADLEYDPHEYPKLLRPIVDGNADAVFGSRFAASERAILRFWHSLGNKLLTLFCNILNDLNLTDMETCYKVVRADILRGLRLTSNSVTIEPELTTRLAQWGARIFEVPVTYRRQRQQSGDKPHAMDGVKAIWEMIRCRFLDTRFTLHTGMFVLRSVEHARSYNRWLVRQVAPFLGDRVAEAGAGIGNMSQLLADREHLLLVDHDPIYVASLRDTFQAQGNVRVAQGDLTEPSFEESWLEDKLDTVFCANVLEHLGPHQEILSSFYKALTPGGHCIIIVPAEPSLYNGLDTSLGHHRRYRSQELQDLMSDVGFEVVFSNQVCRLGSLAWFVNGRLLRRRRLTPRQMLLFDRCWPVAKWIDPWLPWSGMCLIVVGKKTA